MVVVDGNQPDQEVNLHFDLKNSFRPSTIKYTQSPPAL